MNAINLPVNAVWTTSFLVWSPGNRLYYFTAQLQLAYDYNLPVIVHARRAVDLVIKYLRRYPGWRGHLVYAAAVRYDVDRCDRQALPG